MSTEPRMTARLDQTSALLNDLVKAAREHLPRCDEPHTHACPGGPAIHAVLEAPDSILPLLMMALVRLARVPEDTIAVIRHIAEGAGNDGT